MTDETLSIYEGQTRELTATITPTTVTNKELTWSTSDSKIAEVKNGVVTGIGVGSCTITVKTSNGKTSKCTVEVKELTVKKIEAVGDFRTEYYPTESFSPKGLMVEVTYSDNSKKTISDGFTYSEEKKSKIDSVVTVKYKEKTCEIKIHYNEASVTIIGNSEVLVGGSLELSVTTNPPGQNVTEWTSSDNSIAKVNAKGVVTGIKVGKVTITAKAKYATDTKTITVKEKAIKSVSIYHGFNKSSGYYLGDTISTDGLKIKVVYVDNTTEIISSGIEITPDKVEKSPNQTVTVKWGSYTAGELNVKSKSPSIVINRYVTTLDEGKDYQFVAKTDPERVSVTWNSTGPVTVDANGKVMGTGDGEAIVTVKMTYNGTEYKDTRNLTVRGRTVSSISIGGSFKTTYWYGEKIDTSGMVVTVKYSNGQTEEKTYGFDVSPSSATSNKIISSTTGSSINETITVTYGGKSATKQITIKAPRITITANKTVLYQGENTSIEIEKIPSEGGWGDFDWYVSDDCIQLQKNNRDVHASVDESGRATIKCIYEFNGKEFFSNEIAIEVKKNEVAQTKYMISEDSWMKIQQDKPTTEEALKSCVRIIIVSVYDNGKIEAKGATTSAKIEKFGNEFDIWYSGKVGKVIINEDGSYSYESEYVHNGKKTYDGELNNY